MKKQKKRVLFIIMVNLIIFSFIFPQLPCTFTNTAHIDNGDYAYGVIVPSDATTTP